MPADPLLRVFLGAIALASLVQAALLVVFAIVAYRVARRADDFGQRVQAELRPHLERVAEINANLEELSGAAVRQIPDIEATVQETAQRVRHASEVAERLFVKPMAAAAMAFALFRGFRHIADGVGFLKLKGK
jgi:hypothetical protein